MRQLLLKIEERISSVRENENIEAKEHWFDSFFIDSDTTLSVSVERFEFFDEVISKAIWLCEVVNEICEACRANVSMIVDLFSISHIDLTVSIERDEQNSEDFWTEISWCSDSNVWEDDDFDEVNEHWVDVFFIDSDTVSDALDERCEIFDEVIVSKIIVDSNICFDVAIKISNSCEVDETDESSKTNFFSSSHSDLSVLIERDELLMSFFATCCSRTCSRSFFFELKLESQRMQIIFEVLIFANETSAKSTRKISIHSLSDADFMMLCLSYQISKTKSQKQVSNKISRFDFRYRCWHCWRCCKNFANSLNCRFSHVRVESKISIFWSVDVDFATSFAFNAFDLIRLTFLIALNLIFFAIFRAFDFCCFRYFCETDEINEMIKTKTVKFSMIWLACSSRNCKTNSYACWFWATHEEYWRRCESQIS